MRFNTAIFARSLVVSLVLLLVLLWPACAFAGQYNDFLREFRQAKAKREVDAVLLKYEAVWKANSRLNTGVQRRSAFSSEQRFKDTFEGLLYSEALAAEGSVDAKTTEQVKKDVAQIAKEKGETFVDDRREGNWLQKGLEEFGKRVSDIFRRAEQDVPSTSSFPGLSIPPEFIMLLWILLGAGVAVALSFLAIHLLRSRGVTRIKRAGLLDEDEPLLSSDEWLTKGDKLIESGEYREAVRCYYLAKLMRLDQHDVLLFDRHETNWEHYRRFTIRPGKAAEFDLRPTTLRFDYIWYGHEECTRDEAGWFRSQYIELKSKLERVAA